MKYFGRISMAAAAVMVAGALSTGVAQAASIEESARGGSASTDEKAVRGATVVVGGGVWSYGVGGGTVDSAYDNQKLQHSTAVKSSGVTKSSGKVAKGKIAWASRPSAWIGNQAFWNIY